MNFEQIFYDYKEPSINGRYITLDHIEPLLKKLNTEDNLTVIGSSVLDKPIYAYQKGTGKIRILMWSQMHGNESTTTKAIFDFLNLLTAESDLQKKMLSSFTFYIIPMLNPDGSESYTRENANKVDLNRDSQSLTQPESRVLRKAYQDFKPDYCYNMHDQRTIFAVGDTGKPATISFLAPSYNEERQVNEVRSKAINVIAAMDEVLQQFIPGQVGRFDDGFNINCIGDTFQYLGTPTILFEAGHFQKDYQREESRKFLFIALLSGFLILSENDIVSDGYMHYLNIPQNKALFFDFVYKNIKINYDSSEIITNFAAQYKEELIDKTIIFNAFVIKIGDLENYSGHAEFDGQKKLYSDNNHNIPELNQKADFFLDQTVEICNGIVRD